MDPLLEKRFIEDRKTIIARDFASLNPEQRQAVMTTEGPLLILAGAGSGKTTVLIHRVENLLRYGRASDCAEIPGHITERDAALVHEAAQGNVPVDGDVRDLCAVDRVRPWQILAITFTNKAAGELKERLERRLGSEAEGIWAMTFHSACARILRRDADLLGFGKSFTIYDSADSLSVMKRVIRELNVDEKTWQPKAMLHELSRYKSRLLSPEEYVAEAEKSGDIRRIRTAQICAAYARHLREADAMDFDDLLYYCVKLLQEYPEVTKYYQEKFRYVLIDEYQDTSAVQDKMAALLSGGRHNLCVVGDDDQSIYRFRGAVVENFQSFARDKKTRCIKLEQNYRSTGNILAAANAVIAANRGRLGKTLRTEAPAGAPLRQYIAANENDEADFVARSILQSGRSPRDFAVLYRTNAQSRSIEQSFRTRNVPYRIFGGTRFYDRAEVKDMLAYLCVIANPSDETRLLRIVNNPPRGIGAASIEKARAIAQEEGKPLFEVMRDALRYPELGRSAGKMTLFTDMIIRLQGFLSQGMELDEFYDRLLELSGYVRALEEKKSDENIARIENVMELKSTIVKSVEENNGGDLYAYLDEVALYSDLDNYNENAECAVMMTIHASKGLEFPVVFLVGAEEGLFPGLQTIGDEVAMEEERRLCYVAITRAKELLYLTCAAQRMLYGRTSNNLPSRFLEDIPPALIERRESSYVARSRSEGYRFDFQNDMEERRGKAAARGERMERRLSREDYIEEQRMRQDEVYGRSPGSFRNSRVVTRKAPPAREKARTVLSAVESPEYTVGDRVQHKTFGKGTIVKLTPMGGDALTEIEFEEAGVKRLMLRVAAQHMTKLEE